MLIPRYWSRADIEASTPAGRRVQVSAWGGSRTSRAEAEAAARARVERIAVRIRRGEGFPDRYGYGERPLREEVVREYPGSEGRPSAAITRNSYGVLVLNTARVAFIDVDLPDSSGATSPTERLLRWILRRPAPLPPDRVEEALGGLRRWLERHPSWGVRVYRTRSGLRYLITHGTYSPDDPEIAAAMEAVGADPRYRRLCNAQMSFRARLTPKPWRIGMGPPPHRFPWSTFAEEQAMRRWLQKYEQAAKQYATCRFVEALGEHQLDPEVNPFVRLHDDHSRAASALPLA